MAVKQKITVDQFGTQQEKVFGPSKAIREKCLDCCAWQRADILRCAAFDCPLHGFRMGSQGATEKANKREKIEVPYKRHDYQKKNDDGSVLD